MYLVIADQSSYMKNLLYHYKYEDVYRYIVQSKEIDYILACALMEEEETRLRRWQVRPIFQQRSRFGAYRTLLEDLRYNDAEKYFNHMRMEPATFDHLLSMVGPWLEKETNFRHDVVTPEERLAITIR